MPGVAIFGSCMNVCSGGSLAALGRALHIPGDWITICLKWADWCLASPGLSAENVAGGVGCFLLLLPLRLRPDMASPELFVGDVAERDVRIFFFALGIALRTSCSLRLSPGLSVRDVDRAVEVGVKRAPGLCAGLVRGREWRSSPLLISLVPCRKLSVGDTGEAAGGDVVLTPTLAVRRVGGCVRGVASTGRSLAMSPELSVRDVGEDDVGARLPRNYPLGEWKAVCCVTRRLQHGYLRNYPSGQRTVDRGNSSLPFCEESGSRSVSLAVLLWQLPKSPLREMPSCFWNDMLEMI